MCQLNPHLNHLKESNSRGWCDIISKLPPLPILRIPSKVKILGIANDDLGPTSGMGVLYFAIKVRNKSEEQDK